MLRCLVWLVLFSVYLVVLECNLANRGQKPQLLKEQLVKLRPRRAMDRARQQTFSMVSLKDYVALLTLINAALFYYYLTRGGGGVAIICALKSTQKSGFKGKLWCDPKI